MWNQRLMTIALVSAIGSFWCTVTLAQERGEGGGTGEGSKGGSSEGSGSGSTTVPAGGTTTVVVQPPSTTETSTVYSRLGLPGPGFDPDKGLPSSSREAGTSGFDLTGPGSTGTVRGGAGNSFVVSGHSLSIPLYHFVRRGDTLWDLCDRYYSNPWAWPRVWSYNPQVENPHWIYPGDRLRMREGVEEARGQTLSNTGFVSRRPVVPEGTVFLRNQGYLDEGVRDVWGELSGSPDDQMLLADGDEAYLRIKDGLEPQIGQELTIVAPLRKPDAGDTRGVVVDIKGTIRVTSWDPKTHIARATIVESTDVIERGDMIAPVGRRFDVVSPVPNTRDLWGKVAGAIHPREILGQNQVVIVDKGKEEGLRPGNRLFVVRTGDRWRESVKIGEAMAAHRIRYRIDRVDVERAPDTTSGQHFPQEVVGEIRVLRSRPHSATCLVTRSDYEIEPGDVVVARKGY